MRPVPVVLVDPGREVFFPFRRVLAASGVGPFAERGLDEAFRFSVGPGSVGGAVVGQQGADGDAEPGIEPERGFEEGDDGGDGFVREDGRKAIRVWSSMATWKASAPMPRTVSRGSPVTRWLGRAMRTSFLMSKRSTSPGRSCS